MRRSKGLELDEADVTYFLGRETLIVDADAGHGDVAGEAVRADGSKRRRATTFFRLPPERVVELGVQVEI